MTTSGPDQPDGGFEYPPLEHSDAPVDYPTDAGLPPPIYSMPPQPYPGAPGPFPYYDPYRPTSPPGTNGKAVASLVTSLAGALCCAPLGIVGVILGVIAMRETRSTGQDGHGLAMAGTIVGGVLVLFAVLGVLAYVALIASGWSLV
jgi:Domain of unknown function (DUF4190)